MNMGAQVSMAAVDVKGPSNRVLLRDCENIADYCSSSY